MLSPFIEISKAKLDQRMVLALADYRQAWGDDAHEDTQEALLEKACKAVAAVRVYDIAKRTRDRVTSDQFWTLVERYARMPDFISEVRYPQK